MECGPQLLPLAWVPQLSGMSLGPVGHGKELGFDSKFDGKPLDGSELGSGNCKFIPIV